ncbi:MAG: tetratricopeptide repeat protein [Chloroflexota bacterium]
MSASKPFKPGKKLSLYGLEVQSQDGVLTVRDGIGVPPPEPRPTAADLAERDVLLEKIRQEWIENWQGCSLQRRVVEQLELQDQPGALAELRVQVSGAEGQSTQALPLGPQLIPLFEQCGRWMWVLGQPGSGKTSVLHELVHRLGGRASRNQARPVPVVLNLSTWKPQERSLARWAAAELERRYQVPVKLSLRWLESSALVLLLDGLEQVPPEARLECVQAIQRFAFGYSQAGVVVSCDPQAYAELAPHLEAHLALRLLPLEAAQVEASLRLAGRGALACYRAWAERPAMQAALQSPLLLDLFLLAVANGAAETLVDVASPEELRQRLLENYAGKALEDFALPEGATREDAQRWLAWIARNLRQRRQRTLFQESLQPDWLPPGALQTRYAATVRWPARLIVGGYALAALGMLPLIFPDSDMNVLILVSAGLLLLLASLFVFGVAQGLFDRGEYARIRPPGYLTWSWSGALKALWITAYTGYMNFFPAIVVVNGLQRLRLPRRDWRFAGISYSSGIASLHVILALLLCSPLLLIFLGFLARPQENVNLVLVGLSLFIGYVVSVANAGYAFGGRAVFQYNTLMRLLRGQGLLSADLEDFLYGAAECHLLCPEGSGYAFIQPALLDYFAALDASAVVELQACLQEAEVARLAGDPERAVQEYGRALAYEAWPQSLEVTRTEAQQFLAQCQASWAELLLEDERFDEALACLSEAVEYAAPQQREAALELRGQVLASQAQAYLRLAEQLFQEGANLKAIQAYSQALEYTAWEGVWLAWQGRAYAHYFRDDYLQAVADCTRAIQANSQAGLAWAVRGECHCRTRQYELAVADCTRALELGGDPAWLLPLRGDALRRLGQFEPALADLNSALALEPQDQDSLHARGLLHLAQGRYAPALDDLLQACNLSQGSAMPYSFFWLAVAYRLQGSFEQAGDFLGEAIQEAERLHHDLFTWENALNLALFCLLDEDTESAGELYQEVLDNHPPAFRIRKAVQDLDDLLAFLPDLPQAAHWQGVLLASLSNGEPNRRRRPLSRRARRGRPAESG